MIPDSNVYSIHTEKFRPKVEIFYNGKLIAQTKEALLLKESAHYPTIYLPRKSVNTQLLQASSFVTFCPFKGNAHHFHLVSEDKNEVEIENAAWSYVETAGEGKRIEGYFGFYTDKLELKVDNQNFEFGKEHFSEVIINDSLAYFTLMKAPFFSPFEEFFQEYFKAVKVLEPQLSQISIIIRTLHPQLNGYLYKITETEGLSCIEVSQEKMQGDDYQKSPFRPVVEGLGGVRAIPSDPNLQERFPILGEYHKLGFTDYCALPLMFSDGQIHVVSVATKNPRGFSTAFLGSVYQSIGGTKAIVENHVSNQNIQTLIQTYLGKVSGENLLKGSTKRGDGSLVDCAVFFCDLRNSTNYISKFSSDEFLSLLSEYFDAVAEPVLENGGEIVHYLGDAVLAFFPVMKGIAEIDACDAAYTASKQALDNIAKCNSSSSAIKALDIELQVGISLHFGECLYCNIGTKNRMDFTTIGPCINKAVRVESHTKLLEVPLLCTQEFTAVFCSNNSDQEFQSHGKRRLRGFKDEAELFSPKREEVIRDVV